MLVALADPDTLLPLSGLAEHDYGPDLPRALELEFSGADFAGNHVFARRADSAASLNAETGGHLALSPRWDEVMRQVGIGDVAATACRDALGCWGWVGLDTRALTERLFISRHTVQDHLKSRRELLATFNASGHRN